MKFVFKELMVNVIQGVATFAVNVGTDLISDAIMEEIADKQFFQYFEKWVTENNGYKKREAEVEARMTSLFNKYGLEAKKQI